MITSLTSLKLKSRKCTFVQHCTCHQSENPVSESRFGNCLSPTCHSPIITGQFVYAWGVNDLICVFSSQSNNYTLFSDFIRVPFRPEIKILLSQFSCQISANSLMNIHEQYGHGKARFEDLS